MYSWVIGTTVGATQFVNNFNNGNSTSYNPAIDFAPNTTYYVTITPFNTAGNATGCTSESFKTEIATNSTSLIIPKYFTPNGDGIHDNWFIADIKNEIQTIYIYDRYGKLIKNIAQKSDGWNGTLNSQPLPASDYWYVIELKNSNSVKGHFTLKR